MSTGANEFWEGINKDQLSPQRIEKEFACFKSSPINYKIALFNPEVNGVRYLKTLTHFMAAALGDEQWALLNRVEKREVGGPIAIKFPQGEVCLDYLQALDEYEFLTDCLDLSGLRLLEIGAGYGRTAHFILSNSDIADYTILDLPNALGLAQKYLQTVLPAAAFSRLRFIPVSEFSSIESETFDLAINIDSFAEMDKEVVLEYLRYIDSHCQHFYVKNPVAKYLDKTLDGHSQGEEVIKLALAQGVLTDIIDIDDHGAIAAGTGKFLEAYQPAPGWQKQSDRWAPPFTHVWQTVFCKQSLVA